MERKEDVLRKLAKKRIHRSSKQTVSARTTTEFLVTIEEYQRRHRETFGRLTTTCRNTLGKSKIGRLQDNFRDSEALRVHGEFSKECVAISNVC